jgi:SHS2 domain-containing protein
MDYYNQIDHTADLGIVVWGVSCKQLFENAASAMYDLISDLRAIKPLVLFHVKAEGIDKDELLKNRLSELLYYFHVKNILLCKFDINSLVDHAVESTVYGEVTDKRRHVLKHEIKAVTYNSLKIVKKADKLQTNIIFDV